MPQIRLPGGAQRRLDQSVTAAEVAASVGPGLAGGALVRKVDGDVSMVTGG